jgi:DNA-binding MarR family transcriptional regulator
MKETMSFSSDFANLSLLQIQALIFIKRYERVQMSEIAQNFTIELPSATSLVNKLCILKLVERKSDESDRRLVRIVLTRKGEEMLEKVMNERSKNIRKNISILSEDDRKDLLRITKTLLEQMQKMYEK